MSDHDPRDGVDALRRNLRASGEDARYVQFEPDRRHLLSMSDNIRLVPSEIGEHRHEKILRHCCRMAALATPPTLDDFDENDELHLLEGNHDSAVDALLDAEGLLGLTRRSRAAAESIVRWINEEYSNEHTNQDYRTALRSFGRYRDKLDEPPETLAWIPTGTSNDFDPVPSERDLLQFEYDVLPMIKSCHNPRDRALIAVQFEAGCRSGELYDLRVGDIFDGDHTVGLHVDGKRGERAVHLITSVPYLQKWLNEHPGDDGDYLWSKLNTPERPSYNTWMNYFKNAAERADVSKDVTPTNFRKSNTRYLVLLGFSQPRIEDRQGRKRGSEHTARYMARFGDESNEREYARLHGKDVGDEETVDSGPIECPRCHRDSPRHEDACVWCQFALSHEAVDEINQQDDRMWDSVKEAPSDADDAETATVDDVDEIRDLARENPVLRQAMLTRRD